MATFVTDPFVEEQIRAERAKSGVDRFDEVWEGTYMMTPAPNNQHQRLVARLTAILEAVISDCGLGEVFSNLNVSDREDGWLENFREPDVAVVMKGSRAKDCDTHFCGGPDFLIEIVSPDDRSRDKFEFYGKIGVRELMIIDRDPWSLELHRPQDAQMQLIGKSCVEEASSLFSEVIPLSFCLLPGKKRPQIEMMHGHTSQRWLA